MKIYENGKQFAKITEQLEQLPNCYTMVETDDYFMRGEGIGTVLKVIQTLGRIEVLKKTLEALGIPDDFEYSILYEVLDCLIFGKELAYEKAKAYFDLVLLLEGYNGKLSAMMRGQGLIPSEAVDEFVLNTEIEDFGEYDHLMCKLINGTINFDTFFERVKGL